jgi:hypothetical protein
LQGSAGVRIVNRPEVVVSSLGQRNLPVAQRRMTAVAERAEPRMPQWSDRPAAANFRGHLIDLLV